MTFDGSEHPIRNNDIAEAITGRVHEAADFIDRPFGYDPSLVVAEYTIGAFVIEVLGMGARGAVLNIGLNDNTRWDGFVAGSQEFDEFLTILNYHHAKAKGEVDA